MTFFVFGPNVQIYVERERERERERAKFGPDDKILILSFHP